MPKWTAQNDDNGGWLLKDGEAVADVFKPEDLEEIVRELNVLNPTVIAFIDFVRYVQLGYSTHTVGMMINLAQKAIARAEGRDT